MNTLSETSLSFDVVDNNGAQAVALIVAAGSSRRMGGENKLFAEICGVPVIVRTLKAFERSNVINKIVLVTKDEDIPKMQSLCDSYFITKLTDIVSGGSERADSVKNGISTLTDEDKYVLIHDGARPLVSEDIIFSVTEAVKKYGAAACCVKMKDTVKTVTDEGYFGESVDRSKLCCVQTPQGFSVELYKSALASVNCEGLTDDTTLIENFGKKVYMTEGSYKNLKITTPEDLIFARAILENDKELL